MSKNASDTAASHDPHKHPQKIVLIAGFEAFNAGLYRDVARRVTDRCPDLEVIPFSDRDLTRQPEAVAAALDGARVFFASLVFDYDSVQWLRDRVGSIPIRLVFESALELMAVTQLGEFSLGTQPQGMPKAVRWLLDAFHLGGKRKEEDRLAGYVRFLKTGPQLLKFVPLRKVQDLRHWLLLYGYWNAGGADNVAAMCWLLAQRYLGVQVGDIPPPRETPTMGLLHPDREGYFAAPRDYEAWYRQQFPERAAWPVVGLLLYRKHVITQQVYIPQLIRACERDGLVPLPVFINGVEGHMAVRDWMTTADERQRGNAPPEAVTVDALVSTLGFPLVGGPAGSMEAGRRVDVAVEILSTKNVPYLVAAPLLLQDLHSWTRQGIGGLQGVVLYALPELDGAIDTVPLGGLVGDRIFLVPDRLQRLTGRLKRWIALRRKPVAERKIAIVLYGFPPGYGAVGTAALLNVPRSLMRLLQAMKAAGYTLPDLPDDGETLVREVKAADEADPRLVRDRAVHTVPTSTLETWLGTLRAGWIERTWGGLTGSGIKTVGRELLVNGVRLGNVWIGVQPPLGLAGDPMRLMFERDLTPHPQYAAFYRWIETEFQADAIVHFGMHGTLEWLPGSPLGNTGYSWPDILLGNLPHLYVYAANNPSESLLAKRRGYGLLISHNVPPYGRAGLYKELLALRDLVSEYREHPDRNAPLQEAICKKITDAGLECDCPLPELQAQGLPFTYANVLTCGTAAFERYLDTLYSYLQVLEMRLFSSGLHVLGEVPDAEGLAGYLTAYFGDALPSDVVARIASGDDRATVLAALPSCTGRGREPNELTAKIDEAIAIRTLLAQTPDEIDNLLRGLNGEYVPPAPGGDLLRDGIGVLPTGRNIHALDPYRMPSPAAFLRGQAIARQILAKHRAACGSDPETVAVMLWGLDAIKTRGESLGILLELVGAEPLQEATGRIVRYELRSLDSLGHPRIDVLANLSGIFRDSFANILELLDDLFQRAADCDEPPERNFIRKHALELRSRGIDNGAARLFSNPAGDFGSLVNDRVVDSTWTEGDELGQTWRDRNAFSYGRRDRGAPRPEVLSHLLQTTQHIVQEIDSVEYGLTDIQEYYANTGGLQNAAMQSQRSAGDPSPTVRSSFVESFSRDTTPRDLDELLRLEYRTKLLNPQWAQAMAAQGSGGAYEISQRMTALIGWGGTTGFADGWVYDRAAETYILDPAMAKRLRDANPEAFRNIVGRAIEAHARKLWHPSAEVLTKLQALYAATDDMLEGIL